MNRRLWTAQELAIVREMYPHRPTVEIAARLGRGRTVGKVYAIANKLGVHKTAEFLAAFCRIRPGQKIGAAHCFPKGHVPANKGTRRPGYGPGRMKETQFKKGQRPPNKCEVGELRLNADGYVDMKVCEGKGAYAWRAFHRVLWEDANGPVPAGHALFFKDRDKMNVDPSNLELVSRADVCRRNSIHNLPPKLKGAIYMLGALHRRINREEQNRGSAEPSLRNTRRPARQGKAHGPGPRKNHRWRRAGHRRLRKSRERVHEAHRLDRLRVYPIVASDLVVLCKWHHRLAEKQKPHKWGKRGF